MRKSVFLALTVVLMLSVGCASRRPLPPLPTVSPSDIPKFDIPEDPAAQGYRVDPKPLQFEERRIVGNVKLDTVYWLDSRYLIANLQADEKGDYSNDHWKGQRALQIVRVDTQTGEVSPTPYQGRIACLTNDRFITSETAGRTELWRTHEGRYGEPLKVRQGWVPKDHTFNRFSCSFVPEASVPQALSDGRKRSDWVTLREEHGSLLIVRGTPLPADTHGFSPPLQRLMGQPFMRNMGVVSWQEQWYLVKPDGREVEILINPGEAAGMYSSMSYVPYKDAYFIEPYTGGRPFEPEELRFVPRFARLLYPDGRVERFGIPDMLWKPYQRRELTFNVQYTRLGLIWWVSQGTHYQNYRGPLEPGAYLDDRSNKTLKRMPRMAIRYARIADPQWDGCWALSRGIEVQSRPYPLVDYYYINLCTGEKP